MLACSARIAVASTLVLTVTLVASSRARAADPSEVLIRQGVELRRIGKPEQALEKFEEAYKLSHSPRSAAQLGLCEMALGRWISAELSLTEALAANSDPWINRNRSTLSDALGRVGNHLGTLIVWGGPDGALVVVNGEDAGQLPRSRPVRVLPGEASVVVNAPGFRSREEKVMVAATQTAEHAITLVADAPSPPYPTSAPEPPGKIAAGDTPRVETRATTDPENPPFYRSAWVWAGAAGVALAVIVGVVVLGSGPTYPDADNSQPFPRP